MINPNIFNFFDDFKKLKIYPKTIKVKPQINAPAIGSFLKKLVTLGPCSWLIPSISIFPKPKILLPVNLSI